MLHYGLIILVVILVLHYLYNKHKFVSVSDGEMTWNILKKYNNQQAAANAITIVNQKTMEFLRFLKAKYRIDETDDIIEREKHMHTMLVQHPGDIYKIIDSLLNNYNPEVIYENDPQGGGATSYTIGKGNKLYLCVRDKEDPNKIIDHNTLMFVMLHEISHMANYNGWGHGRDFWEVFCFILHESILAGVYTPIDYKNYPVNYCGLRIDYQPLYDTGLRHIWE